MAASGSAPERHSLGSDAFDSFLSRLDSDRDLAGKKYTALHRKLELYFAVRRCEPDSATLADTTLNRVATNFLNDPALASADAQAYALGVARFVVLEYWKKASTVELKQEPPAIVPEADDQEEINQQLRRCLQELPEADRQLAVRYYPFETRQKVNIRRSAAQDADKSQGALRVECSASGKL